METEMEKIIYDDFKRRGCHPRQCRADLVLIFGKQAPPLENVVQLFNRFEKGYRPCGDNGHGRERNVGDANLNIDSHSRRSPGHRSRLESDRDLESDLEVPPDETPRRGGDIDFDKIKTAVRAMTEKNAFKDIDATGVVNHLRSIFSSDRFVIQKCGSVQLFVFGSTLYKAKSEDSDLDVAIMVRKEKEPESKSDVKRLLRIFEDALYFNNRRCHPDDVRFEQMKIVFGRVPILSFVDRKTKLKIDLGINKFEGVKLAHLYHIFYMGDPTFSILVNATKIILKMAGVYGRGGYFGHISSAGICSLVAHFLRMSDVAHVIRIDVDKLRVSGMDWSEKPPAETAWRDVVIFDSDSIRRDIDNVDELLKRMFSYFATFPFDEYKINIANRSPIRRGWSDGAEMMKPLAIECPVEKEHNLAISFGLENLDKMRIVFGQISDRLENGESLGLSVYRKPNRSDPVSRMFGRLSDAKAAKDSAAVGETIAALRRYNQKNPKRFRRREFFIQRRANGYRSRRRPGDDEGREDRRTDRRVMNGKVKK